MRLGVFHHPHGHGGAYDPGHRSHGTVVMVGGERHGANVKLVTCLIERLCPAFQDDRPAERALHGSTHVTPINRRSRVEKPFLLGQRWNRVSRFNNVH